jgi:hypothetical protein
MELLQEALETIPGLTLVFAIASLLLLDHDSELAQAIRVFVVAWLLYRLSSGLDKLWDLVYGPRDNLKKPDRKLWYLESWSRYTIRYIWGEGWRRVRRLAPGSKSLEVNRSQAASELGLPGIKGLYKQAKTRMEKTEEWKHDVYRWIGYSKAARAFIIPSLFIFIMLASPSTVIRQTTKYLVQHGDQPLFRGFAEDFGRAKERLEILGHWVLYGYPTLPALFFLGSLVMYVWFRVRHMNKLYRLVYDKADGQLADCNAAVARPPTTNV